MKKIALTAAAMGGTALIAFGASGTFAAFQDTSALRNEAGAGTLVLDSNTQSKAAALNVAKMQPGEGATYSYFVRNGGNLPGVISAGFVVDDQEKGCLPVEDRAGDKTCGDKDGEFADFAKVTVKYIPRATAATCTPTATGGVDLYTGTLASLATFTVPSPTLNPNEAHCVVVQMTLEDAGNINQVQGDAAAFTANFTLKQTV
ncbi:TasA family protein [Geodermatophilus sp. CPCC 205761]|uniref:TasA family protein n=1 Tax=Geodermatophilus sp. CPCC 205761 TaxID=2936597 RepID=UPI003EEFC7D4